MSVSLVIYPWTWGSDQSWSGGYIPPISFAQLTQNVRWSKYHCDPRHPGIAFMYIIWHGGDIFFFFILSGRSGVMTCFISPGWVKNTEMSAFKCIQVLTVPLGLTDWQDRADKGKVRQMREGRLADKEIRQYRVGWWMSVGRTRGRWMDW